MTPPNYSLVDAAREGRNAVTVSVARWIGRRLMKHSQPTQTKED